MHYLLDPIFKKFAEFEGRASRKEFSLFFLGWILIGLLIAILGGTILTLNTSNANVLVELIRSGVTLLNLILFIPTLALSVRRLHDLGSSGWVSILYFVPLANLVLVIILAVVPGNKTSNQYG